MKEKNESQEEKAEKGNVKDKKQKIAEKMKHEHKYFGGKCKCGKKKEKDKEQEDF